uniref:Uncharacterized protein n=1 Tax=Acrobeloides nanus TaxID=290746 RepID=A0A914D1I2_9BILA
MFTSRIFIVIGMYRRTPIRVEEALVARTISFIVGPDWDSNPDRPGYRPSALPLCYRDLQLMPVSCMLFGFGIKHMGPVLTSSISWVVVLNPIIVIALVAPYRDAVLGRKRVKRVVKYTMVKMRHSVKRNLVNPNDTTVQGTGSERIYTIA